MLKRFKPPAESIEIETSEGVETTASFKKDWTVLTTVLKAKLAIATSCGGMGTCGTCRVHVLAAPSELEPRNEIENEMAEYRSFEPDERLACQITACRGLKIRIP